MTGCCENGKSQTIGDQVIPTTKTGMRKSQDSELEMRELVGLGRVNTRWRGSDRAPAHGQDAPWAGVLLAGEADRARKILSQTRSSEDGPHLSRAERVRATLGAGAGFHRLLFINGTRSGSGPGLTARTAFHLPCTHNSPRVHDQIPQPVLPLRIVDRFQATSEFDADGIIAHPIIRRMRMTRSSLSKS